MDSGSVATAVACVLAALLLHRLSRVFSTGSRFKRNGASQGIPVASHGMLPLPWKLCSLVKPALEPCYVKPYLLGQTRLVVTTQRAAQDLYKNEGTLARPRDFGMSWILRGVLGDCLFVQTGQDWRRLLKVFKKHFAPARAVGHASIAADPCMEFVEGLISRSDTAGAAVPLSAEELVRPPFEAVGYLMYGKDLAKKRMSELYEFCEEMDELTGAAFSVGSLITAVGLPSSLSRRIGRFRERWAEFNRTMLEECRGDDSAALGEAAGALERSEASEAEVFDTINEIVLANADFVAAAVAWPLVHLAMHPDVARRVMDELEAVLGSKAVPTTTEDIQGLKYLHAVLYESWRMEPMLIITNPVIPTQAITVAGYTVPAGTRCVVDTKAVNYDEQVWTDPSRYNPERFLGKSEGPLPNSLHVFGLGSRKCLGQYYGIMVAKVMIASLLMNCRVEVDVSEGASVPSELNYGPFEFPPNTITVKRGRGVHAMPL